MGFDPAEEMNCPVASKVIDVMVVVDVLSSIRDDNDQDLRVVTGDLEDEMNDDPAACKRAWAVMMTHLDYVVSGNATTDLHIKAAPGDILRVASASLDNQLDYVVFLYEFQHRSGNAVLNMAGQKNQTITRLAAMPTAGHPDHQPPNITFHDGAFYVTQIDIKKPGKESFYVKFVAYGPPSGDSRPVLGCFQWKASITVS